MVGVCGGECVGLSTENEPLTLMRCQSSIIIIIVTKEQGDQKRRDRKTSKVGVKKKWWVLA